jgi:CRISPR-associated exonuclease Cas4
MYTEDDLLPLSALQHLQFCERQCALIHIEQQWVENRLTAEGRLMHERVHSGHGEKRRDVRVEFTVPLRSLQLGLSGQADVVEFHRVEDSSEGFKKGRSYWKPFPVEYKRGRPKKDDCDRIQLCAQALCLEEMLSTAIPDGALFYGKTRRRQDVVFDVGLRDETVATAQRLHAMVKAGRTPMVKFGAQCKRCSFLSVCMPKPIGKRKSITKYLEAMTQDE